MSLIWSLLGVVILTAGYELIRELSRRYEAKVQREIDDLPSKCSLPPSSPPLTLHILVFRLYHLGLWP